MALNQASETCKNITSQKDAVNLSKPESSEEDQNAAKGNSSNEVMIDTISKGGRNTEQYLKFIIEKHRKDLLIFAKNKECPLSEEVHAILQEHVESRIRTTVLDVEYLTTIACDFNDTLKRRTGHMPPVVFYRQKYIGNYSDIVIAHDFGRLDLILNPPKSEVYQIVVVGSGPGAQSVIKELEIIVRECNVKKIGKYMKIAVVDHTFALIYERRHIVGVGPQSSTTRSLLWKAIKDFKASSRVSSRISINDVSDVEESWIDMPNTMHEDIELANRKFHQTIAALNIDYFRGSVIFTGHDAIEITTSAGSDSDTSDEEFTNQRGRTIIGMNFIICGGTLPKISQFSGFENCVTIEQFLKMREYPSNALIIGNTPEALEVAYLIASYGGECTVMNKYTQWLPGIDHDCAEKCMQSFNYLGVRLMKITKIIFIEEVRTGYKVRVKLENQKHYTKVYVRVIVDHRRVPISSHMNMEAAGVALEQVSRKIIVDKEFRSSNPAIWAFGGVAKGHLDTLEFESLAGKRVIRNILNEPGDIEMPKYFPRILMTPLEYAYVGDTEKTAKLKYKTNVKVYESEITYASYTGERRAQPKFSIKIICVDQCLDDEKVMKKELVIGVHCMGKYAGKLIQTFPTLLEDFLTKEEFEKQVALDGPEMGLHQTPLKLKYNVSEINRTEQESLDLQEEDSDSS